MFYAGGPTAPYEARIKQFQEKFPGIQVSVSGGFSNVLNQRIEQQLAAGKLEVDFAFFQTVQDFVNWKKRGELLAFKPDGFDQIIPTCAIRTAPIWRSRLSPSPMPITPISCAPRTCRNRRSTSSSPRFKASSSASIRTMTTPRSIYSTLSCRSTVGAGWIATWPTSRTSSRAISRWRAPLPKAGWPPRSTQPSPRPAGSSAGRADRDRVLGRRRDAGVHRHRRHLQGCATS